MGSNYVWRCGISCASSQSTRLVCRVKRLRISLRDTTRMDFSLVVVHLVHNKAPDRPLYRNVSTIRALVLGTRINALVLAIPPFKILVLAYPWLVNGDAGLVSPYLEPKSTAIVHFVGKIPVKPMLVPH